MEFLLWSCEDVANWIASLGFPYYRVGWPRAFTELQVDFCDVTEEEEEKEEAEVDYWSKTVPRRKLLLTTNTINM